jgi:hypothetical protein
VKPQFPIYIVSKGRADTRYTALALESYDVPYYIIVEAQERDLYAAVIDPRKILVLDPKYQRDYDTFDKLGETKSKGPGAARNFAWDHSIAAGFAWHWVMDDNIRGFWRFQHNRKIRVADGTIIRAMEDFCLRFRNLAMAGPNYYMFAARKNKPSGPFTLKHAHLQLQSDPKRYSVPLARPVQRGHRPIAAHPQSRLVYGAILRVLAVENANADRRRREHR